MENFLASRPSIAKLGVKPKASAHLFTSLANRTPARPVTPSPSDPSAAPATPGSASPCHEPQVELVRENGAVTRIVVVCKCGERTELDCIY